MTRENDSKRAQLFSVNRLEDLVVAIEDHVKTGLAAVHRTVEVTAGRGPKISRLSEIAKKQILSGGMASRRHLNRVASRFGKLLEHAVEFPFIKLVSARVS